MRRQEFGARVGGVEEAAVLEHCGFPGGHKGFAPGVVLGNSACGPALAQTGAAQERTEDGAAILAAAIAVEEEARSGPTGVERLLEGLADEAGAQGICQRPADDFARAAVDDDGAVKPARSGGDEGTAWNEIACRRPPAGPRRGRWQMSPAQTRSDSVGRG